VKTKAKSIRSEITDRFNGLVERIVRLINTIFSVIYPSFRLPETQQKEEQEEQEQERKEHDRPKKVTYSCANVKLVMLKRGRALWGWGVGKAETIPVLSRAISFGKNFCTRIQQIFKPQFDILIRTLAYLYAKIQLKKRISVACIGIWSLVERSIQYIKKTSVREMTKDVAHFFLDLRKFAGQSLGLYSAHSAHFDVLATDINQLLKKIILLPEEGSDDHDHDQDDTNTSSQSPQPQE